ncbi:MAG: glycosyltransferase family 2 protein [Lachnospiraceae bacterium]|nr:glycosyltransferase family 2 protein [Lachnospiraceae bacterium]
MKEVTVIIPNYNGIRYISHCLDALKLQSIEIDIIVVDNGSDDGSDEAAAAYEGVRLIKLDENTGFCHAVNVGIKAAKTDYVILLNNDTRVGADFAKELLLCAKARKDTFSVASKMLQMSDPGKIDSAGDLYCALGWAFSIGKDGSSSKYDREEEVFSACAGAAIYKKSLIEKLGYFDEQHISYLEDLDIGYRARINGYINRYTPKAVVYHAGSGTTGSRYNAFKVRMAARNSIYVIHKNMPIVMVVLNLPFLLAGFGIKMLYFAKKGFGREYVTGIRQGFSLSRSNPKYPLRVGNTLNYCRIQLELWINIIRRITG